MIAEQATEIDVQKIPKTPEKSPPRFVVPGNLQLTFAIVSELHITCMHTLCVYIYISVSITHVIYIYIYKSWAGFDPSFKCPTCLATLKSCDTTKKSVCG